MEPNSLPVHQPLELINTGRSRFWVIPDYSPDYFSVVNTLPLESKPPIMIMGRECHQQRDVGFFSDTSEGYRYSGALMRSQTMANNDTPAAKFLAWLLPVVNTSLSTQFNGILVNRYNTGQDYLSAHSDSEFGLDPNKKSVAGISYGATRTFRIRDKLSKAIVLDYPATAGTLMVMEGDFQDQFTHEIPKQLKVTESRISLTFRRHLV